VIEAARPRVAIVATHVIQYQVPLWRRLAERGVVDVSVGFLATDGATEYSDPGFGGTVRWDGNLLDGYPSEFIPHANAWVQSTALCAWIRRQRADAVLVHGHSDLRMLAAVYGAPTRTAVIMRGESSIDGAAHGARKVVRDMLVRNTLKHCHSAVAIGTRNRDFYEHFGLASTQIFDSPYAVDNAHFRGTGRPPSERMKNGRPVVLFSGKLIERKRPMDLVDAAQSMANPPYLVFCGDGHLRSHIESRLKDGLGEVRGFVPQSQLPEVYGSAAVVVLPSEFETWGLVINEAMAAGCIPITSDRVGCGVDLVQGVGEQFTTADVSDLRSALRRVLESEMGERQRLALDRIAVHDLDHAACGIEQAILAIQRPDK
jgi:glycosyltransferase involved in cell wall biosynthesis